MTRSEGPTPSRWLLRAAAAALGAATVVVGLALAASAQADPFIESNFDLSTVSTDDNSNAVGIWGHDDTSTGDKVIYVVNDGSMGTNKIFAYDGTDGSRVSAKDFDTLHDAQNDNPRGIWSHGTTMYVVDDEDKRIRAYTLATKARDSDKDITLDGSNDEANGIWGNGTTIWVVNDGSGSANKLYAYKLVDDDADPNVSTYGDRDTAKDFDTLAAAADGPNNRNPRGIWSDGKRMWVVDDEDNRVYAYHMGDDADTAEVEVFAARAPAWDFPLHTDNADPQGAWSNGDEFYVVDSTDNEVYVYKLQVRAEGFIEFLDAADPESTEPTYERGVTLQAELDTVSDPNGNPAQDAVYTYQWIRVDGDTETDIGGATEATYTPRPDDIGKKLKMRIGFTDGAGYSESLTSGATPEVAGAPITGDFELHSTNTNPQGIWGNDTTIWVADFEDLLLRAYDHDSGARASGSDIRLVDPNTRVWGIWSDGTTMWVTDPLADKLFAYTLTGGNRYASEDITVSADHKVPAGAWASDTTIWVANSPAGQTPSDKVFAYNRSTGNRDATKDFDTLHAAGNHSPQAIWSDGHTMWVVDKNDWKAYAYLLSNQSRQPTRDFCFADDAACVSNGNDVASGAWSSNGETIWVTDRDDDHLYSYTLPDRPDNTGPTGVPTIAGTASVGETLTAVTSTISDQNSIANATTAYDFSYQWLSADSAAGDTTKISGATASTYALVAADAGKLISVRVSFIDGDGYNETVTSDPTNQVAAAADGGGDDSDDSDDSVTVIGLDEANSDPSGIWGDDDTIWVANSAPGDATGDKIFAYNRSTGNRDAAKDFDTLHAAGNNQPRSIWSSDTTMFVVDFFDAKVYAYQRDGTRIPRVDIPLVAASSSPSGIWGNNETIWVANDAAGDVTGDRIFAYRRLNAEPRRQQELPHPPRRREPSTLRHSVRRRPHVRRGPGRREGVRVHDARRAGCRQHAGLGPGHRPGLRELQPDGRLDRPRHRRQALGG